MDVLVTGANGTVGTAITDHLADDDRYAFTLLDVEEPDGDPPGEHVVADVRESDALRPHVEGQDAVVHLALTPGTGGPGSRDLGWSAPLADNLEGIHNVTEAAVDAGVDSLVFASSNHAVGMVEVQNAPAVYHGEVSVDHTEPHRPDSPYGLTKCYGEDLGRLAAEAHDVRFYALRIGSVRDPPSDHPYGDAERGASGASATETRAESEMSREQCDVERGDWERGSDAYREQVARMKGLWQSRRDLAHMVECCLQDDSVEWDHFYGVSGNERRWLDDLEHARETIGYEPRDDGEEWDAPPG